MKPWREEPLSTMYKTGGLRHSQLDPHCLTMQKRAIHRGRGRPGGKVKRRAAEGDSPGPAAGVRYMSTGRPRRAAGATG